MVESELLMDESSLGLQMSIDRKMADLYCLPSVVAMAASIQTVVIVIAH